MSVSKKIRFEVFKRDSFTCQYCGLKAPDVILHADHVEPRKEGGKDHILNLITACSSCNGGKGAVRLDDESALRKGQKQAELLQDRREQIEMIAKWHSQLIRQDNFAAEKVSEHMPFMQGYGISEEGTSNLSKWVKKYGLAEILECTRISFDQYYKKTHDSWQIAFHKIPRIAACREIEKHDPILAKAYLYRGTLRSRLSYIDWANVVDWLKGLLQECGEDTTYQICNSVRSWRDFVERADEAIMESRQNNRSGAVTPARPASE